MNILFIPYITVQTSEMYALPLKKIEELTLHVIELDKRNKQLESEVNQSQKLNVESPVLQQLMMRIENLEESKK